MGMFDYVVCEYPLPGTPPKFVKEGHQFQTKSFQNLMEVYVIDEDGLLNHKVELGIVGDYDNFTGTVEFYTSNWSGVAGGILFTRNGEDCESVTYEATFVKGHMIELKETERARELALKSTEMHTYVFPTKDEKAALEARRAGLLLSKNIIVWHGGHGEPYPGTVVAESDKEICVMAKGRLEILDRWSRDVTFFDTLEDGQEYTRKRKEDWDKEQEKFKAKLAEKASKSNGK